MGREVSRYAGVVSEAAVSAALLSPPVSPGALEVHFEWDGKYFPARLLHLDVDGNLTPEEAAAYLFQDRHHRRLLSGDQPREKKNEVLEKGLVLDGQIPHFLLGMLIAEAKCRPWIALHAVDVPADGRVCPKGNWDAAIVVRSSDAGPPVGAHLLFPRHIARAGGADPSQSGQGPSAAFQLKPGDRTIVSVTPRPPFDHYSVADVLTELEHGLDDALVRGRDFLVDETRALWALGMVVGRLQELGVRTVAVRVTRMAAPEVPYASAAVVVLGDEPGVIRSFPDPPIGGHGFAVGGFPGIGKTRCVLALVRALDQSRFSVQGLQCSPDGEGQWTRGLTYEELHQLRQSADFRDRFRASRRAELSAYLRTFRLTLADMGGQVKPDNRDFLETCGQGLWFARDEDQFLEWDKLNERGLPVAGRILVADSGGEDPLEVHYEPVLHVRGGLCLTNGTPGPKHRIAELAHFLYWYPLLELACRNNEQMSARDPARVPSGYRLQPKSEALRKLVTGKSGKPGELDELLEAVGKGDRIGSLGELADTLYYLAQLSSPPVCGLSLERVPGLCLAAGFPLQVGYEAALDKYRLRLRLGKDAGREAEHEALEGVLTRMVVGAFNPDVEQLQREVADLRRRVVDSFLEVSS